MLATVKVDTKANLKLKSKYYRDHKGDRNKLRAQSLTQALPAGNLILKRKLMTNYLLHFYGLLLSSVSHTFLEYVLLVYVHNILEVCLAL